MGSRPVGPDLAVCLPFHLWMIVALLCLCAPAQSYHLAFILDHIPPRRVIEAEVRLRHPSTRLCERHEVEENDIVTRSTQPGEDRGEVAQLAAARVEVQVRRPTMANNVVAQALGDARPSTYAP